MVLDASPGREHLISFHNVILAYSDPFTWNTLPCFLSSCRNMSLLFLVCSLCSLGFGVVTLRGMQELSFPTKGWAGALCNESVGSQPLEHQARPLSHLLSLNYLGKLPLASFMADPNHPFSFLNGVLIGKIRLATLSIWAIISTQSRGTGGGGGLLAKSALTLRPHGL